MEIPIEPTTVSFVVAKLYYDIKTLMANEYVEINAYLAEASGNRIKRMLLKMEQPTYSEWGNDDQFLMDWIKAQVFPPTPPPPPEPTDFPNPEPVAPEIVSEVIPEVVPEVAPEIVPEVIPETIIGEPILE